ncbi:eamA-like transporter family protein [Yersinia rochesterensis]|uniref:EamA-like transporter family protein n=1 Tax=Yersinia rochesterensis TaxID=1604335 RepID=A0ABN4FBZ2_9GAMM|nr:DMT family transporter [Yersinia rochesterensis]AIN16612.1 eamA-like transporter family protein [Yersinia rochesterensis]AJI85668.1 eamA-like transporter family protein [Yersinia frederiksenii Y225]AJJ34856.1 eamA-like transporter family protein [Yersinia rochesterensis]CRY58796.1 putative inner membrane protein [Yersinia kristensenii]
MAMPAGLSPSVARSSTVRSGFFTGKRQGYVLAIISAMLLGFTGIIIRILTVHYHLPTSVLAFWRAGLVAAVLLPILLVVRPEWAKLRHDQAKFYLAYGLLLAVFNGLWTESVALNGASISTILVYCSVGFTVFLGWIFYNEYMGWRELIVIVISLVGCFLVSDGLNITAANFNFIGLFIGLASGVGYSFYTLAGRIATDRRYPVWNTILYVFGFSAIYQLIFNQLLLWFPIQGLQQMVGNLFFLSRGAEGIQWSGWWLLLILAAGPTLLGFGLFNLSLKTLPLAVASLILTLELIFTAVIAYFLLGETLSAAQLLGSALVLLGVLMLHRKENVTNEIVAQNNAAISP